LINKNSKGTNYTDRPFAIFIVELRYFASLAVLLFSALSAFFRRGRR
jgi:hypothetical protein